MYQFLKISVVKTVNYLNTVEPLKTKILPDRLECPSLRGVRLIEVIDGIDVSQKEVYL